MKQTAILSALSLWSVPPPMPGQFISGSFGGTVVDPTDAAIPEASLTLTHVLTGRERTTATTAAGDFVFGGLESSPYTLAASKDGFKTIERREIILSAGERLAVAQIVLELGAISAMISVTAEAGAVVQTQTAERSSKLANE